MAGIRIDAEARTHKATRDVDKLTNSVQNVEKQTVKSTKALKAFSAVLGGIVVGGAAQRYINSLNREFIGLENQIALVTGRGRDLLKVQKELLEISEQTRASYGATVKTFTSFGRALAKANVSNDKIARVTKIVQQSIAISGANAATASASIIQLGQGLAAGALRGEELNSVMEGIPRLAQAIADEMDVNLGKMRLLAAEGKITSQVVFNALLRQAGALNKEFAAMTPTLEQANVILRTNLRLLSNEFVLGTGIAEKMGNAIFNMAGYLKEASKRAKEVGSDIAVFYLSIAANIKSILGPLTSIAKSIVKQFIAIFPQFSFTRTLESDFIRLAVSFDKMTGGWIESWKRFKFYTLFQWRSDVEKAFFDLRRASPRYWIGAGWNVATLKRIFSTDLLFAYGRGFKRLSEAIENNLFRARSVTENFFVDIDYLYRQALRYGGFKLDTIFTFRRGLVQPLFTTLSEISRGFSTAQIHIWETGKILRYHFFPALSVFKDAALDSAFGLFSATFAALKRWTRDGLKFIKIIGSALYEFLDYKSYSRYLKTFSESFVESFRVMFPEISEVLDVLNNRLANWFITFAESNPETAKNIAKFFANIRKVLKGTGDTVVSSLDNIKDAFNNILDSIFKGTTGFINKINNVTKRVLDNIYYNLVKFKDYVIEIFRNIYDKVIGHSYWTDMIHQIRKDAKGLWPSIKGYFNNFESNVINMFQRLTNKVDKLKIRPFSFGEDLEVPTVSEGSFGESLLNFGIALKKKIVILFRTLPDIMRVALLGVSTVIVSSLFPVGRIKTAILAALIASIATTGTLLAEKFGAALTGGSLVYSLGYRLGLAAGYFFDQFFKKIPEIANAMFGIASSFTRGFLEEIPVLKRIVSGIFSGLDFVGLSGTAGLLMTFLFGRAVVPSIARMIMGKDNFDDMKRSMDKMVQKYKKGGFNKGIIGSFLFGTLGPLRLVGALGLILEFFGAFDSIFQKSYLVHIAATGGFLGLFFFGKKGVDVVIDNVKKAVAAVSGYLGSMIPLTSGFQYSLFGNPTTATARALVWLQDVVRGAVSGFSHLFSTKILPFVYTFIQRALFGSDTKETIRGIKQNFSEVYAFAKKWVFKLFTLLKSQSIWTSIFNGGQGGRAGATILNSVLGFAENRFKSFTDNVLKPLGKRGFLGRYLYGPKGKAFIIGGLLSILSLISSKASASETSGESRQSPNALERLLTDIKDFHKNNPIQGIIYDTLIAIGIATAAMSYMLVRTAITSGVAIRAAFSVKSINDFTNVVLTSFKKIKKGRATLGGGILSLGAGAAVGGAIGGADWAFYGAILASSLGKGFYQGMWKVFSFTFSKLFTVLIPRIVYPALKFLFLSPLSWLTAGTGLFLIWLFGEPGNFQRDVKRVWTGIKNLFIGVANLIPFVDIDYAKPFEEAATALSKAQLEFLKKTGTAALKPDDALFTEYERINFDRLNKAEKKALENRQKDLRELFTQGRDADLFGQFDKNRQATLKKSIDGYRFLIKRLAQNTAFDAEKFSEQLASFAEGPQTHWGKAFAFIGQKASDMLFYLNRSINEIGIESALESNNDRLVGVYSEKLKELNAARSTQYNAYSGSLDPVQKRLKTLNDKTKEITISNEKLDNSVIKLKEDYLRITDQVLDRRNTFGEWFNRLFSSGPGFELYKLEKQLESISTELEQGMLDQLTFEEESLRIKYFNSRILKMGENFKKAKIEFSFRGTFLENDTALKRLEDLSKEAERLAKNLENVQNVSERNRILQTIQDLQRRANEFAESSVLYDNIKDQFQLGSLIESELEGISFDTRVFKGLSESLARELLEELVNLKTDKALSQQIATSFGSDVGPSYTRNGVPFFAEAAKALPADFFANAPYILPDTQRDRGQLEARAKALKLRLSKVFSGSAVQVESAAGTLGLDFNTLVRRKGFKAIQDGVARLTELQIELNSAILANDADAIRKYATQFFNLQKVLNRLPDDVDGVISSINSLGFNISKSDLATFSDEGIASIKSYAAEIKRLEESQKNAEENFGTAGLIKYRNEIKRLKLELNDFLENVVLKYGNRKDLIREIFDVDFSDLTFAKLNNGFTRMLSKLALSFKLEFENIAETGVSILGNSAESIYSSYVLLKRRIGQLRLFQNAEEQIEKFLSRSVKQGFEIIQEAIPEYPLTLKQFRRLPRGQQERLEGDASRLSALTNLSDQRDLPKSIADEIAKLRSGASLEDVFTSVSRQVRNTKYESVLKSPIEILTNRIEELTNVLRKQIGEKTAGEDIPKVLLDEPQGDNLQRNNTRSLQQIATTMRRAAPQTKKEQLLASGIVDAETLNRATPKQLSKVFEEFNKLDIAKKALEDLATSGNTTQKAFKEAQEKYDTALVNVTDIIEESLYNNAERLNGIGKAFSDTVIGNFKENLTAVVKGDQGVSESLDNILENITDAVIENFVDGLVNSVAKSGGLVESFLGSIGSVVTSGAENIFPGIAGLFGRGKGTEEEPSGDKEPGIEKTTETVGLFAGFFDTFKAVLGIGTAVTAATAVTDIALLTTITVQLNAMIFMLNGYLSGIVSLLGALITVATIPYASGGIVSGPGTGTSDSIPAMLSAGEYVVNAAATKNNLRLLTAINEGRVSKYATGGLVQGSKPVTVQPVAQNQTEVNLYVTGDISRQTKKEIYGMMPQIAAGVNNQNHERGFRR